VGDRGVPGAYVGGTTFPTPPLPVTIFAGRFFDSVTSEAVAARRMPCGEVWRFASTSRGRSGCHAKFPKPPRPPFLYGPQGEEVVLGLASELSDSGSVGWCSGRGELIASEYELRIQSAQDSVALDMVIRGLLSSAAGKRGTRVRVGSGRGSYKTDASL
jgi:hypothetical protein